MNVLSCLLLALAGFTPVADMSAQEIREERELVEWEIDALSTSFEKTKLQRLELMKNAHKQFVRHRSNVVRLATIKSPEAKLAFTYRELARIDPKIDELTEGLRLTADYIRVRVTRLKELEVALSV